jgi:hypothetical protein
MFLIMVTLPITSVGVKLSAVSYDNGCAGRVVEGHHTSDYKRGYADGQASCSEGKSSGGDNNIPRPIPNTMPQPLLHNIGPELQDNEGSSTSSRINWEDLYGLPGYIVRSYTLSPRL